MNAILSEIESQLVTAFRGEDWLKAIQVIELTRDLKTAEQTEIEAKQRREGIKEKLATLTGAPEPSKDFKGRRIRLRVTYGSRKHGYLLVTRALNDGLLSVDEKLKIYVPPTGDTFETGIYARNKHLTERQKIKKFFRAVNMAKGDSALLEEIKPGEWILTKVPGPLAPPQVQETNGATPPSATLERNVAAR